MNFTVNMQNVFKFGRDCYCFLSKCIYLKLPAFLIRAATQRLLTNFRPYPENGSPFDIEASTSSPLLITLSLSPLSIMSRTSFDKKKV